MTQRHESIVSFVRSGALALLIALAPASAGLPAAAQSDDSPAQSEAYQEGARQFINKLSEDAVQVWRDSTKTETERQQAYRDLLYAGFDVNFISRLVLGRHVRTASREQLETYQELFPPYIINTFASRIGDYGNEKLEILGVVPAGSRDVFVRTNILRPNAEPIAVDWRVRKVDNEFQIVDIKVEGISMAITQRDEFSSIINRQGFDGLLTHLREGAELEPRET